MSAFNIVIPQSRPKRLEFIRELFPKHSGSDLSEDWQGGREEGLKRLALILPAQYGKTRNYLDGEVTHLSPYIRHGCLSLLEVIHHAKSIPASNRDKLLFEFAWRDYWRQVWYFVGDRIHSEMEPPKVKLERKALDSDIIDAKTGLMCMDHFVSELKGTGYLHNHARMWLASYMIYWRGIDWRLAAHWMHDLLLDGDQASNTLSWQWVASTFGSKPYFFNQENLSKYTHNRFCGTCKANCPFKESYETLNTTLFKPTSAPAKVSALARIELQEISQGLEHIVLFHDEMLSANNELYRSPKKKVFIFDPRFQKNWALKRLQFIADCLVQMPEIEVWVGDTREVLGTMQAGKIETQNTPNSELRAILTQWDVTYEDEPAIYSIKTQAKLASKGIVRFSKYWNEVSEEILN